MNRILSVIKKNYSTWVVLIVLFAGWQLAVMIFHIPEFILPTPLSALERLFVARPGSDLRWAIQISATVSEVLISFAVTAVIGVTLAIIISWSEWITNLVMPLIIFMNSLPIIAIAPLILLWFGYGLLTNILIAFLVSFFPVLINAGTGLSHVDEDLLDLVRYLHASKLQVFIKIRFPNSLPYIFSGLKICSTMCVVGAIVGEFIASDKGLGFIIVNSQSTMNTPPIFAALIVVSTLGVLLFSSVSLLERILMPWYEPETLKL